jgi:hypothetical protein
MGASGIARVTAGGVCGPTAACGDGLVCFERRCTPHDPTAGVLVAQRATPTVCALSAAPAEPSFILAPRGGWPLQLSLREASGSHRATLWMHHGKFHRRVLPELCVYWHVLSTESEQAAFAAVPAYQGQPLDESTYLAIAHRAGARVAVLRVYDPTEERYVALSAHYASASVGSVGAGSGGFTHTVWVT